MKIIKAPNYNYNISDTVDSIFLAGSIEMGTAEDWQEYATKELAKSGIVNTVFNPRRSDWDSSWKQTIANTEFKTQVNWELDHLLRQSEAVLFYFSPGTQSPSTLLELGLTIEANRNVIVVCPEGYWRKGNVEVTCDRYRIPVYETLDEGILAINSYLKTKTRNYA